MRYPLIVTVVCALGVSAPASGAARTCGLLTTAQIARALAEPATAGYQEGAEKCFWASGLATTAPAKEYVSLAVHLSPSTSDAALQYRAFSVIANIPVGGLGDHAGFQKLRDGGVLSILKGRRVITLELHSKRQKQGLAALTRLGRAVVGKL